MAISALFHVRFWHKADISQIEFRDEIGPISNRLSKLAPQRLRKRVLYKHTAAHRYMKGLECLTIQGGKASTAAIL